MNNEFSEHMCDSCTKYNCGCPLEPTKCVIKCSEYRQNIASKSLQKVNQVDNTIQKYVEEFIKAGHLYATSPDTEQTVQIFEQQIIMLLKHFKKEILNSSNNKSELPTQPVLKTENSDLKQNIKVLNQKMNYITTLLANIRYLDLNDLEFHIKNNT